MSRKGQRSLRKKASKTYIDGMDSDDDDSEFHQNFDVEDRINTKDYPPYFIKELKGEDVSVEYFQKTGFYYPIFVREKTGLNMKIPDQSFTVTDVKNLVGARRILEVMNCATQLNAEMTLKDWEEFYTDPDRVVRQIDFTDNVWPRHLKELQDDGTNDMSKMHYPKVQKYCLMSVAGCYTDFHIDLGGTSVWYHVLKGKKVFWLIPPTDANLKAYETWTLSGKQEDVFFGDMVEKCGRVVLESGNTFMIPSGWIHAVYTPEDSLVFGGNFLHPYAMERQLRVAQIEETTKVPHKFRFPYFTEMLWYLLDKYAFACLGRHHLKVDEETLTKLIGPEEERKSFMENIGHPHLTAQELRGLKSTVLYIHSLPVNKKNVPSLLKDPVSLIRDIRTIVESHKHDMQDKALTGRALLFWPGLKKDGTNFFMKPRKRKLHDLGEVKRVVCKKTESLLLPVESQCSFCGLDGWMTEVSLTGIDRTLINNALFECQVCHHLAHRECFPDYGVDGIFIKDMPSAWRCPKCVKYNVMKEDAKLTKLEPVEEHLAKRQVQKAGFKSEREVNGTISNNLSKIVSVNKNTDQIEIKEEPIERRQDEPMESTSLTHSEKKLKVQVPCADVVRKASLLLKARKPIEELVMDELIMIPVFRHLGVFDLTNCGFVCKTWLKLTKQKQVFDRLDLSGHELGPNIVASIVRYQPSALLLNKSKVGKQQLAWMLPRIVNLQHLSLTGLEYTTTVSALSAVQCSSLASLDLSYVANLTDNSLYRLIAPHKDSNSSLEAKSNLCGLRKLAVGGTEITDYSLRHLSHHLSQLVQLSLSGCLNLTDHGLLHLGALKHLSSLDISKCSRLSDTGLVNIVPCSEIYYLDCRQTQITQQGLDSYVANSSLNLKAYGLIAAPSKSKQKIKLEV